VEGDDRMRWREVDAKVAREIRRGVKLIICYDVKGNLDIPESSRENKIPEIRLTGQANDVSFVNSR
jgi:hypothetical protein